LGKAFLNRLRAKVLVCGAFIFAIILALILIVSHHSTGATRQPEDPSPDISEDGPGVELETRIIQDTKITAEAAEETTAEEGRYDFNAWYFYDETRIDRYVAFSEANPDLDAEDVVWMVDCDLDKAVFEDAQEVSDPDSIVVLVSKHFSLPSEYTPSDLAYVGSQRLRVDAANALSQLISDSADAGLRIWASSGFRSYEEQVWAYNRFITEEGEYAANRLSAQPGFSEHQTGLSIDICGYDGYFEVEDEENAWLAANAHRYGFIVRYTYENQSITGYIPEEWHLRYIGVEAATTMFEDKIPSFEEYWVKHVLYKAPD
jgi:D-alanyl-D-alanine carboxypeptidase